ncbi:MAG: 1,4-dihydroxy-2-naphthoateoctaprenyltransferase [Acidimicrobiales bacterium]|nr:1,4-dihydroxy-2-naphthoateoctaprenyltransferase [Acidimicrobiales bacterium]
MNVWVAGARPRTLPAAIAPVLVGAGVAVGDGRATWWRIGLALIVALAIQVGTNYANDYSDGIRGTDSARVGPVRLVAAGLAAPAAVRLAALLSFAVAGAAGLVLAAAVSWWLVPVGAACFAAGWLYTGGPRPYGYAGLGEVFVFVFFGLVATAGTAYVAEGRLTGVMVVAAVPVGLLATALLVVNNLRDIPTDAVAGKRTLAVRLGDARTRDLFTALVAAAALWPVVLAFAGRPGALWALLAGLLVAGPIALVREGATGPKLIPVLGATGRVLLFTGLALGAGLALG